jgi:hypothetical protein
LYSHRYPKYLGSIFSHPPYLLIIVAVGSMGR